MIAKDATASVFQNLIRILSYKNELSLIICNMRDSENWYDTYSFILSKWVEKVEQEKLLDYEKYKHLFKRKSIKKSIMTSPYSVSYLSSREYFLDALIEDGQITNKKIDKGLEEIFLNFFRYIKEEIETNFFLENSSLNLVDYAKKKIIENGKLELT
jgi:hypothetical protein